MRVGIIAEGRVIQIDTAEAELAGYDVARPGRQDPDYVEALRGRVVDAIGGWLGGQFAGRVRHAVAVEEIDAWVLTLHTDKDTAVHRDPKRELSRALHKTLPDKQRKRLFQLKTYQRYDELTRPFRKLRDLEKHAGQNRSLRLFVDSLGAGRADPG